MRSDPGMFSLASFILLAQHSALQPLLGLHSTPSLQNNTTGVLLQELWSDDAGSLGLWSWPSYLCLLSDNVLADTLSFFRKTEKLSDSAVLLGPNRRGTVLSVSPGISLSPLLMITKLRTQTGIHNASADGRTLSPLSSFPWSLRRVSDNSRCTLLWVQTPCWDLSREILVCCSHHWFRPCRLFTHRISNYFCDIRFSWKVQSLHSSSRSGRQPVAGKEIVRFILT